MNRRSIEIDFDVHKLIEGEKKSFAESDNLALRRLLRLPATEDKTAPSPESGREWFGEGVTLPHGTELRMTYNGRLHAHRKIEDGQWKVEAGSYSSPSAAAGGVARTKKGDKTNLDGWNIGRRNSPAKQRGSPSARYAESSFRSVPEVQLRCPLTTIIGRAMNAQEPINHHYLPIFYQQGWATDGRVVRYYRPHDAVVASITGMRYTVARNISIRSRACRPAVVRPLKLNSSAQLIHWRQRRYKNLEQVGSTE